MDACYIAITVPVETEAEYQIYYFTDIGAFENERTINLTYGYSVQVQHC